MAGSPGGQRYQVPGDIKGRVLPDNINTWESFVRAAVTRYPEIKYWSIWNEPNSPTFFRGNDPSDTVGTLSNIVPAYETLVAHAAPWIRNNPDGQGRRFLVAPESIGGNSNSQSDEFLREVIRDQGSNIDVVAVHTYGAAGDAVSYMQYLHSSGPLNSWGGEVWLPSRDRSGVTICCPGIGRRTA